MMKAAHGLICPDDTCDPPFPHGALAVSRIPGLRLVGIERKVSPFPKWLDLPKAKAACGNFGEQPQDPPTDTSYTTKSASRWVITREPRTISI
jgi:hypothetical protein